MMAIMQLERKAAGAVLANGLCMRASVVVLRGLNTFAINSMVHLMELESDIISDIAKIKEHRHENYLHIS